MILKLNKKRGEDLLVVKFNIPDLINTFLFFLYDILKLDKFKIVVPFFSFISKQKLLMERFIFKLFKNSSFIFIFLYIL